MLKWHIILLEYIMISCLTLELWKSRSKGSDKQTYINAHVKTPVHINVHNAHQTQRETLK